jgi:glycosyltransferase involved in cell wall biosynthesis
MANNSPEKPLISFVVPVYNSEPYLVETIQSLLGQTYSPLEVIAVVDEGSTDRSANIVRDFAASDIRLRPLFLSHGSQWRARNAGIAVAQGQYIAHMDDDDIALPDRLVTQLAWMRRTNFDIFGGNTIRFGTEKGILWFPETHQAICHELLFRIALFLPTAFVRTDFARTHPYDETLVYSDYVWLTQVAHRCRLGNMPHIVLKSRCHSRQAHIVYNAEFRADINRLRRPYFHTLFPDATEADYTALAEVAEKKACADLETLERTGAWLTHLAQTPDNHLRQSMADRWQAACQRSAHLGLGCYRLYRHHATQFGVLADPRPPLALWLLCALRLRSGSRLYLALAAFKWKIAHLRGAASNSGKMPWLDLDN